MAVHTLTSLTWTAIRELPADRTLAVLPTGATEAHGPHLPLGTDIVIAEAMARAGANRLAAHGLHVLLLPAIPVAPAPFAAEFAGTLNTPAAATTALVTSIAGSLASQGIRVTAIANAHHDPEHVKALRASVAEVAARGGTLVFPDLTRRRWAERLTSEFQSGACHAGRYEGSIVLAERPDFVRREVMTSLPANPRSLVDAMRNGRMTFADAGGAEAYFGFPAEATAEEGRATIDTLGRILEEAVMEALNAAKEPRRRDADDAQRGRRDDHASGATPADSVRSSTLTAVNPPELGAPRGFAHGMLGSATGRVLFVAGQTAADRDGRVSNAAFVDQFDAALVKVLAVVRAAGGAAEHIARMTVFTTAIAEYRSNRRALRDIWRRHMGGHYPAMALVEVKALVDETATVEIEATAVLP